MFSYAEYKNLIDLIKFNFPILDFSEVTVDTNKFCLLRHDIEYSIDRALDLARFEADRLGVKSTYLIQLRSDIYSAISNRSIKIMTEIKSLGHNIGTHPNPPSGMVLDDLKEYILNDIVALEKYYQFEIDRFSYHIPKHEYLKEYVELDNKINCYGMKFFHFFEGEKPKTLRVSYVSDSNHQWKYGHPLELNFDKIRKLQLLIHPYSWTQQGYNNLKNFVTLINERNRELLEAMSEIKTFPKEFLI